ncbi:MAG: hypothetical protein MJ010_04235 [Paludibacteraceae bacterium]|nr:hypothetical protein [Paludibacteraceae bacterium]
MRECDVYEFYNEWVKPLYCEIEARNNSLPVELLFEVSSAFDHLKRFHLSEDVEDSACTKAYSHLKRGALDAFKLKLKYFNDDCNKLCGKNGELRLIDNGSFLPKMLKDKTNIYKIAKQARLCEGNKDVDTAFDNWCQVSILINEFGENYFDVVKLQWAEKQGFIKNKRDFWIGVVAGVISSLLVSFILYIINLFF